MAELDKLRTDIMHKASVTIQRHMRGFVVRKRTLRVRRAVIKLQVRLLSCCADYLRATDTQSCNMLGHFDSFHKAVAVFLMLARIVRRSLIVPFVNI